MSEFGVGGQDGPRAPMGEGWAPPGEGAAPTPGPTGNATWPGPVPPPWSGTEPAPSGWSAPTGGPAFSPHPPPPPGRPPSNGALRTLLIVGGVLVVAFVALVAVVAVMIPDEDELVGSAEGSGFDGFSGFGPAPSIDVDAPPEVTNPPADVEQSVAAIEELEQFIFTPGADPTEWEARFTDPTGLREKIEPYSRTLCAVGVRTVVIAVRFLDEHHAEVDYVFVGPNIPEIGRTFVFTGRVRREPGGPWLAEPGGVEQVASLATGYCLQQEVTPRAGLEDETDEKGTHDTGTLVDPLDP